MFYFQDDKQITVYFGNGDIAVWKNDNSMYNKIVSMTKDNEWIKIETLHNQAKVIMTSDKVSVNKKGKVEIAIKDKESIVLETEDDPLLNLIKTLKDKGTIDSELDKVKPFLMNCLENEHINAVHELYEYCKAKDFEITEDGCFLAYKRVNANYGSIYDYGKTKHTIGEYTEVTNFDTNRRNECSQGLHFCSKSYLPSYSGAKVIIVKINPKDVVSIPTDYNFAKGRCKRYMMVGEMAADGTLKTTNLEVATNEKIVKTKTIKKAEKKLAVNKANLGNRIDETAQNMEIYNNDINKVASVMHISTETVKRNMRKYKNK